jgi:hypothetical protein
MPDSDPLDDVVLALELAARGDTDGAAEAARLAAERGSLLGRAVHTFLVGVSADGDDVYAFPEAFQAFIRGGGNVELYRATSAFLATGFPGVHSLLDIGVGDGLALVRALAQATMPEQIRLLEPSAEMVARAAEGVRTVTGRDPVVDGRRLQDLVADDSWEAVDLAEATFALHTLPPDTRSEALAALAPRVGRLQLVEFDVHLPEPGSLEHTRELVARYEIGLAEYDDTRDLVAQGFLVPVLLGQLAPGAVRATWEQPAAAWAEQLTGAGFTDIEIVPVADYWWSPAFGLRARGRA